MQQAVQREPSLIEKEPVLFTVLLLKTLPQQQKALGAQQQIIQDQQYHCCMIISQSNPLLFLQSIMTG